MKAYFLNRYSVVGPTLFIIVSDFVLFNISFLLAFGTVCWFFNDAYLSVTLSQVETFSALHMLVGGGCITWFGIKLRHYSSRNSLWQESEDIIRTLIFCLFSGMVIFFVSGATFFVRAWLFGCSYALVLLPVFRAMNRYLLDQWGIGKKVTVILGSGKNAQEVFVSVRNGEIPGLDVVAFFDTEAEFTVLHGVPVFRDPEEVTELLDTGNFHFIVAFEAQESEKSTWWLRELSRRHCRSVTVIPALRGIPLYSAGISCPFSHEMMLLRVENNLTRMTSRFFKRTFDIVCSLSLILLLSPVLVYLGYRVRQDGGPAIYSHPRVGRYGKIFHCYKYRSMKINSQEILQQLLATDDNARAEWEQDFKLKNDPRITPVGNFLRKTSLDELPQLFNVLKGEMSLVGPRPIVTEELSRYKDDVEYYLMTRPGMTGLWQVSGRNDVDYSRRVYFDAWYVKNWSLSVDIIILLKTVREVLFRNGAY